MTTNEITTLVAHAFRLCTAKRSLQHLATRTPTIECAILDIDEQLEDLASALNVTVEGIWDRFDATGNAISAVLVHGVHRAVYARTH